MKQSLAIQLFHQSLQAWYDTHGRKDLPWRDTRDAYHILLSEIMLQQTQVSTVLTRYYQPFLTQFPDLGTLAAAPLEEVVKQWQGLGYYRRARYLHAIAKQTAPTLPSTFDALIALPGIGKNTAHAVLAFAHHLPYPVMEANVKRVICRIHAITDPTDTVLWRHAQQLLNRKAPFDYNQAMMDLGAMVCTPTQPNCQHCPANSLCKGKHMPLLYPQKKHKKPIPVRQQNVLVIGDGQGNIFTRPRKGEFLSGLYEFVEIDAQDTAIELNGKIFIKSNWQLLGQVEQVYSHFKQRANIYWITYEGAHEVMGWHPASSLATLPMSKKEQKILQLLEKNHLI